MCGQTEQQKKRQKVNKVRSSQQPPSLFCSRVGVFALGNNFAKIIGERDVAEACGSDATGQNERQGQRVAQAEPRVVLNISLDGLKLRDEKSGAVFYNFPVAKISFIAPRHFDGCARLWLHFRHGGRQTQILRGENGTDGGPCGALHSASNTENGTGGGGVAVADLLNLEVENIQQLALCFSILIKLFVQLMCHAKWKEQMCRVNGIYTFLDIDTDNTKLYLELKCSVHDFVSIQLSVPCHPHRHVHVQLRQLVELV
ncbi:hypothetical protein niasHT_012903 [Heterodera trifolii]|uniref:PID domain-containing protein n=1 Tax=Heterodera trifolii TaxID=157864 RepID=A0ABD2L640_9BILA